MAKPVVFTQVGSDLVHGAGTPLTLKGINGLVTSEITPVDSSVGVSVAGVSIKNGLIAIEDGSVSDLAIKIGADINNGIYGVSDVQLGVAIEGTLVAGFDTNGLFTSEISERIGDVGVSVDGALIKDGSFIGKQATATATVAGLTTGLLSGADQFVTVTSASANNCICLPSDALCPIGTVIRGWVGANGFELRSLAADTTQTINGVTAGVTNEAAIPATTKFKVEKVASLTWLLTAVDELGAVITAIVPDAI
jgi:hypothetical protein